jgi:AbrB family looped-hinge helix DNA binding protein
MAFPAAKYHCIITWMTTTLTLDKAGRVVLPKPVRDEMQLRAGDSLELESSEDRIVLRPRRGGVGLHKKHGIWVFGVGEPIPEGATDETLRQMRRERELSFMGDGLPTRRSRRKKSR